jgi:2-hydroxycyclohexanecarboxyl-CoA dehydrogenase
VFDLNLAAAKKVAADHCRRRRRGGRLRMRHRRPGQRRRGGGRDREGAWAPIAVLVNNAGWDIFKPFTKTVPAEWEKLIAINLTGALHMHHACCRAWPSAAGRIVNVASDAARVGSSGEAVYAACKGGLVAFSKTIAREHARHGITVNVVCPGPTDTACSPASPKAPPTPRN